MGEGTSRNQPCPCGSGRKFKKCCLGRKGSPNDNTPEIVTPIRAANIVIAAGCRDDLRKVFQVGFLRSDSSLYVAFPYFEDCEGILSYGTLRAGADYPTNVDLAERGRVSSHRVKYTHHESGVAQFSQTGRIKTEVRRQSVPLQALTGHLFTCQLQGLGAYAALERKHYGDERSKKRAHLKFKFDDLPEALKFVGWLSRPERMRGSRRVGPTPILVGADGEQKPAFLVAPPVDFPDPDLTLALTAERIPLLDPDEPSCLTFIGGFDPSEIARDHSQDTEFLALSYPKGSGTVLPTVDLR